MTLPKKSTRALAREQLLEWIFDGSFQPGEAIAIAPTADALGVSPTPTREALIELERDGFLNAPVNRGFFVKPLTPQEVRELYPVLSAFEALALRAAAFESERLDRLEEINQRLAAPELGPREAVHTDTLWHRTLVGAYDNHLLRVLADRLKRRIARYELAYMTHSGSLGTSIQERAWVVKALRSGNVDAAVDQLDANWRRGARLLLEWLEEDRGGRS